MFGNQASATNIDNKTKHTFFHFKIITLAITAIVFLFGILLLTGHLGDPIAIHIYFKQTLFVKDVPGIFSPLHLIGLASTIVLSFIFIFFFKKKSELTFRAIIYVVWISLICLEFIKQFTFMYEIADGKLVVDYSWDMFPFQFCSMFYYIAPFVIFMKKSKVYDAFVIYLMVFILIGGLAGVIYPTFTNHIYINVQTLIHHGFMISASLFTIAYYKNKINLGNLLKSFIPFAAFLVVAGVLNEVVWQNIPKVHSGQQFFNMFFFSPHFITNLPIFSNLQKAVPYPAFAVIFIFSYFFGAYVLTIICSLITRHTIKPCITLKNI